MWRPVKLISLIYANLEITALRAKVKEMTDELNNQV